MHLYPKRKRNGDRVWWARWTENKLTRTKSTKCTTKAAAEVVVARWERERADPVYAAANDATFGEEARLFLTACTGAVERGKMARPTLGMYREKAGTLVRILGSDARLGSFDGATFQVYIDARRAEFFADRERPITESTLYKEWVTFRGILKQAWRAQRFGRDPASLKPAHFGPEYTPRETALTWPQVAVLLDALPHERSRTVAFVLACGARRSEVFRAQAGDVNKEAWTVRVRGTKTDAADATLPVVSLFRDLARQGTPPFARWPNARRDLAVVCRAKGLPPVTWNDLRRTFCSLLVQAGCAPHLAAKLMRHKSTAMVDRVYGRQTVESLTHLIEAQIRDPSVNHPGPDKAVPGSTT